MGQKLKLDMMLLKIPVPLLLPAWSVAALGPEPSPDEKMAPVEPAAAKSAAAAAVRLSKAAGSPPTGFIWFGG